jgi:CRISPR locus-related DNA-binding protein
MSAKLRIHIAPVGFEYRRVTEPLIFMQADKVYLVTYRADDSAREFFSQIKKELSQNYKQVRVEEVFVDIWNLYDCIGKFREIILEEKKHDNFVYINVSTGTKITSIAGMLSCMLWGACPYYSRVSYPSMKGVNLPVTELVEEPDSLPVYAVNKPKPELLHILSVLKANHGRMRKARLIRKLEMIGIIRLKDENRVTLTEAAKHSQLRALLEPLEKEWKYVRIEASGRRSEVILTEEGETALRIFGTTGIDNSS